MKELRGGMHWKTIAGKEYLYRAYSNKRSRSLGQRSPETEQQLAQFAAKQARAKERLAHLSELVRTAGKINSVHRAEHVANAVADICIVLDEAGLLDKNVTVIRTNAMHAALDERLFRIPAPRSSRLRHVQALAGHRRRRPRAPQTRARPCAGRCGVPAEKNADDKR